MPFPPRDGSSIAMASLIRGLLHCNVELEVITLNTTKHFVSNAEDAFHHPQLKWHICDVNTTPTAIGALTNLFDSASYMVSRFDRGDVRSKVKEVVQKGPFTQIIVDGLFMMPYIDELKSAGVPVLLRAHNVEHHIWNRLIERESNPLKQFYLRLQNKRLASFEQEYTAQADGIIAITQEDAAWFKKRFPNIRTTVMPCGINPERYPEYPSRSPDIFHIGAMDWRPNVDGIRWFVNEVWPKVYFKSNQAVFHLAGRDSERLELHQPEQGIFVEGSVADAKAFFEKHGIFIVPLHAGSGMRIKVLEAMAYGKAIVTTSIGAEGIPVEPGVDCLMADSADEFARAILQLTESPEMRLQLGSKARQKAFESFDEGQLAEQMLTIFAPQ